MKSSKSKTHHLFSSLVYQSQLVPLKKVHALNKDLLEDSKKIQAFDQEGQVWSQKNYPAGYTSYGSMDELHCFSSVFAELENLINPHVEKYLQQLHYDIPKKSLKMSHCWVNNMQSGSYHTMHIHPLSVVSGTYYLQVQKDSPGLKFEDPRSMFFMSSPIPKTNAPKERQRFFIISPQVGDIVLFESWMRHEVPIVKSKKNRISISFNYQWNS